MEQQNSGQTIGGTLKAKANSPIEEAHTLLTQAHVTLDDELHFLGERMRDILNPADDIGSQAADRSEVPADPPVSTVTNLVNQETKTVYRLTEFVRNLRARLEL